MPDEPTAEVDESSANVAVDSRWKHSAYMARSSSFAPLAYVETHTLHMYRKHECGCCSYQPVTCGSSFGTSRANAGPQLRAVCL